MKRIWYYLSDAYLGSEPADRHVREPWFDAPDKADKIVLATAIEVYEPEAVDHSPDGEGIVLRPGADAVGIAQAEADAIVLGR